MAPSPIVDAIVNWWTHPTEPPNGLVDVGVPPPHPVGPADADVPPLDYDG
jgi:hypothetical protein